MLLNPNDFGRNLPEEGVHYRFIDNEENALVIEIIENPTKMADKFSGVVYLYTYVTLNTIVPNEENGDEFDDIDAAYNFVEEMPENAQAKLKFDFLVLENPENYDTRQNPDFELLIGDILTNVLTDATSNLSSRYTMFSKTSKGEVEKLRPIKQGKFLDKIEAYVKNKL